MRALTKSSTAKLVRPRKSASGRPFKGEFAALIIELTEMSVGYRILEKHSPGPLDGFRGKHPMLHPRQTRRPGNPLSTRPV